MEVATAPAPAPAPADAEPANDPLSSIALPSISLPTVELPSITLPSVELPELPKVPSIAFKFSGACCALTLALMLLVGDYMLVSSPLFAFAGYVLAEGRSADRLVALTQAALGRPLVVRSRDHGGLRGRQGGCVLRRLPR